jgi:hypothetical protein
VPITCRLNADLHADVEASAAAYKTQYGDAIPLALLITTIVREYLQKDPAFMRQRRQAETPARGRTPPESAVTRPAGPHSRDGAHSQSERELSEAYE